MRFLSVGDDSNRPVVSSLTPEYACIINRHYSHHGEDVPSDIREYLDATDTNCYNLGKHSQQKPKKVEKPEEAEELIKKKRFY